MVFEACSHRPHIIIPIGRHRLDQTWLLTPYTWAEKFESFERINSIRETNVNFDSCNSCKRLGTSRLHELHESKFTFVSRIEFIRSKLSNFSAHVYGVTIPTNNWHPTGPLERYLTALWEEGGLEHTPSISVPMSWKMENDIRRLIKTMSNYSMHFRLRTNLRSTLVKMVKFSTISKKANTTSVFFINLVRTFWMDWFARPEPALSRACCVGPDQWPCSPIGEIPGNRQNLESKVNVPYDSLDTGRSTRWHHLTLNTTAATDHRPSPSGAPRVTRTRALTTGMV